MKKKLNENVVGFGIFLCLGFFIWVLIPFVNNKEDKWAKKISAGERISEAKVSSVPTSRNNSETKQAQSATVPDAAVSGIDRDLKFTPFSPYGNELFGSMILTWSNVKSTTSGILAPGGLVEAKHYGSNCQVGVILENVKKGEVYEISISGDRFIKRTSTLVRIEEDAPFVTAGPATAYDYYQLQVLRQTSLFNITFEVSRDGGRKISKAETWQAHQINDCPTMLSRSYISRHGIPGAYRLPWPTTFAGYVNENHPWVDIILREALDTKICKSFSGYEDTEAKTISQVMAIWEALANRDIKYSSISTSTESRVHRFQHVRFIEDSIDTAQANCIDGSVLLASLLRKIGLNVGVVIVPGHAYVSVYDKGGEARWFAIETTMMSTASLADSIKYATYEYEYALSKISDRLDDKSQFDFTEIKISKFRDFGVLPIPYSGTKELTPLVKTSRIKPSSDQAARASTRSTLASGPATTEVFDDSGQRRYLADRGVRSALDFDREMRDFGNKTYSEAYKYDHLPPKVAAWMRRRDYSEKLQKRLAQVTSGLKGDPYYLEKAYYWREVVAEINNGRIAFNVVGKIPGMIASEMDKLSEDQRSQANLAYSNAMKVLREVDPYMGVEPANIPSRDFQAVVHRAEVVCNALSVIATLPLDY